MNSVKLIESCITWQGEGPDSGRRMLMLRFKRCDRNCSWCDTQVRMRNAMESDYSLHDLQLIIDEQKVALMITGGEPTWSLNLNQTATLLNKLDFNFANVETNGTGLEELISKVKKEVYVKYILSPKLFTDEDVVFYKNLITKVFDKGNVYIKLVCENDSKIIDFLEFLSNLNFMNEKIFLMPEGTTREKLLENSGFVFDMAEKYKFNFSSRDHIIYNFV